MTDDEKLDRTVDTVIEEMKWLAVALEAIAELIKCGKVQMPERANDPEAYKHAANICKVACSLLADFDEERRARRTADK